ncbi:MarR family transcriptional regulator [Sphingomonas piscis]|uniref:MarR family transcriptional regulator n=1 Tax=Sphingomonas piscis TaxID=2714943 RepID=A0A6G7YM13_9SPHN|nr:MarR family transcriptional regulator [Sphingomonas piscis]QIK77783.1 MarR family transcriptional regulator [Sphingomonas piscis]
METNLLQIGETAHALRRAFDRRAAALGVTRAQWRVLVKLGRHPNLRQVELADLLDVEPITLCRIVDRLEDSGMVERRRDPADRRAWRLALTPKSEPLVGKLRLLADDLAREAFGGIEESELEQLQRALARVRENLVSGGGTTKKASNE